MSWWNIFSDAKDLASEYIEDPDKRNELVAKINAAQNATYQLELQTKTIPWVDALHKMSRPLISVITIITAGVVVSINPELDIVNLLTVIGGGAAPATAYTILKGKGQ
jgi:hypothetical protein